MIAFLGFTLSAYMMFRSVESFVCSFDHVYDDGRPNYYQMAVRILASVFLFMFSLIAGVVWLTWRPTSPY